MKAQLQEWLSRIDNLKLRERALLLFALLAILYAAWDTSLMQPLRAKQESLESRMDTVRQETAELDAAAREVVARNSPDPDRELRQRIERLRGDIGALDEQLHELTVDLIAPREMARVLEQALERQGGLELVSVESLPAEPINPVAPSDDEQSDADTRTETGGAMPRIYRHGVVITFEGGYLATLEYMQVLEAMPWMFLWERLEYEVDDFPRARVTLRLNTLSLKEGWIGV